MKSPNVQIWPIARYAWLSVPLFACSLFLCGLSASVGQGTLRITFDGPPEQLPGTQYFITNYSESGMVFTPIGPSDPGNGFLRSGGAVLGWPDNGTAYLQAGMGGTLMFSFANGSLFNLSSVDLAGYSDVAPEFTADFIGYRPDGSTVSTSFSGTGIDFQTFLFGSQFSGLARVEIPNQPWSLDNLVVSVPEPSGFALAALAFLVTAAAAVRRRRM